MEKVCRVARINDKFLMTSLVHSYTTLAGQICWILQVLLMVLLCCR